MQTFATILLFFQHITHIAHGTQAVAQMQFAAQPGDMGIQRAGAVGNVILAPDGLVQIVPVECAAAVTQEKQQ